MDSSQCPALRVLKFQNGKALWHLGSKEKEGIFQIHSLEFSMECYLRPEVGRQFIHNSSLCSFTHLLSTKYLPNSNLWVEMKSKTDTHCFGQDMSPACTGLTSYNISYHPFNSLWDEVASPIFHGRNQKLASHGFSDLPKVTRRENKELDVTPAWEGSRMESLTLLLLALPWCLPWKEAMSGVFIKEPACRIDERNEERLGFLSPGTLGVIRANLGLLAANRLQQFFQVNWLVL